MAKYRVLDMLIRLGVGDKVRELLPDTVVELTAEEAALVGKSVAPVSPEEAGEGGSSLKKAAEVIDQIRAAETVEAVKALAEGDLRKGVVQAAEKRIAEIEKAG